MVDPPSAWTLRRVRFTRLMGVVALVPLSAYLVPRAVDLVRIPAGVDEAIAHAQAYNPRLSATAVMDLRSADELDSLDRIDAALARVHTTNTMVAGHLRTLVSQIHGDVQSLLDRTDVNVASLVGSLNHLHAALEAIQAPVDGANAAVAVDRARLARALDTAEATARQVTQARRAAQHSARDIAGSSR